MYQKVIARSFGEPDVLKVESVEALPEPGKGEVRVRVEAAGVGYTDTILRRGKYIGYKEGLPLTPGYDMVGSVDALGDGVKGLRVGQRVADMPVHGSYSQYMLRPEGDLIPVPAGIQPPVAVEVPLMWMTAWQMLTRCVTLKKDDPILVVGAAGSVGRGLVVLGRHLGLHVIGTCSARNQDLVTRLGATPIDYGRSDLVEAIRTESGGQGVVAAFDAIGGASWAHSRSALAHGGTLVGYGFQDFLESGGANITAALGMLKVRVLWNLLGAVDQTRRTAVWYDISARRHKHPMQFSEDVALLFALILEGRVAPPAPEVLSMAEAAAAHARIARGGLNRRLVLDPWSPT